MIQQPYSLKNELIEKAKAGFAAIYIVTPEEVKTRVEIQEAVKEMNAAKKGKERRLFVWRLGKGLVEQGKNGSLGDSENPGGLLMELEKIPEHSFVILRFFDEFMEDPLVFSSLADTIYDYKRKSIMLIIVSPVLKLTKHLEKEFTVIDNHLPDRAQLGVVLDGIITGTGLKGDKVPVDDKRRGLISAALGLTMSEAENALSLSLVKPSIYKTGEIWDSKIVLHEKCQSLKKTGLLEYIEAQDSGMSQIGGLKNLKAWIRKRKAAFSDKAKEFGLPAPKGILMVGPPGSGKSVSAKAISAELGMPLLRLDMGKMFGSLVGQSEANIREAIHTAETVAPCILWIN